MAFDLLRLLLRLITCLKLWLIFYVIIEVLKKFLVHLSERNLHGGILAEGSIPLSEIFQTRNIKGTLAEIVGQLRADSFHTLVMVLRGVRQGDDVIVALRSIFLSTQLWGLILKLFSGQFARLFFFFAEGLAAPFFASNLLLGVC